MDKLKATVAENITELRKSAQLTQLELAEKLNYSDKAVSKWERGESLPDIAVLKSIAELFGVTVDYLISDEHDRKKASTAPSSDAMSVNRRVIPLLSVIAVWLLSTVLFVLANITFSFFERTWLIFVFALPVTFTVLFVFSCIWGKRFQRYLLVSLLLWSVLMTLYLVFLQNNWWLLFLVGIPSQSAIILWSRLKFRTDGCRHRG